VTQRVFFLGIDLPMDVKQSSTRLLPTTEDKQTLMSFHQQRQEAISFEVNSFVLFESRVGSVGREYPIVSKFDLVN